jgi:exonuclease SbcC
MVFEPGITIIKGGNGCGKSNFIHILFYFILTGESIPKGPSKTEMVNWGRKSGYVELDFEFHGKVYKVRRYLNNAQIQLHMDGEPMFQDGDGKWDTERIREFMKEAIGMPTKAFYRTCFAPQRKLTEIVEMTHGERMSYMQILFGTDNAETLRGMLLEYQNKLPHYPDRSAEIAEATGKYDQAKQHADEINQQIQDWEKSKADYDLIIDDWRVIQNKKSLADKQQEVATAQGMKTKLEEDLRLYKESANIVEVPGAIMPDINERKKSVDNLSYISNKERLDKSKTDLEAFRKLSAETPVPVEPLEEEVQAARELCAKLEPKYKMATAEEDICPTCKQDYVFEGGQKGKDKIVAEYTKLYEELEEAENKYVLEHRAYQQARIEYDAGIRRINNEVQYIERLEKDIQENWEYAADFDQEEYNQRMEAAKSYNQYLQDIKNNQDSIKQYESQIAAADAQIKVLEEMDAASAEDKAKAAKTISEYDEIANTISTLKVSHAQKLEQMNSAKDNLNAYELETANRAKIAGLIEKFEDARKILHKDNLQKEVMATALQSLNILLDQYLTYFNKDYTAWIDDNFDFRCAKAENPDFRAGLLSGGEKVALSMAYMMALAEVKSSRIPIMVLDEPTDSLDEEATQGLVEVLKIARSFAEKGLFILIPSHEIALESAKSQIVNMEYMRDVG